MADPRRPIRSHTGEFPDETPDDERTVLVDFLEFFRSVFIRKAEGLDAEGLRTTVAASDLTLGGLVKHLAFVEDYWFSHVLLGNEPMEPFRSAPWDTDRDWELTSAAADEPAELIALYDRACAASREILDGCESLDQRNAGPSTDHDGAPRPVNLRWILVHLIEEYARHVGHADLLREAVDGTTGD